MSMNLGTQTPSFHNWAMAKSKQPDPIVGMGVTFLCYTDRHAGTIVRVESPSRIVVREDHAIRTDGLGRSDQQTYRYMSNAEAAEQVFTKRKNGQWIKQGDPMTNGQVIAINVRDAYHDYSF